MISDRHASHPRRLLAGDLVVALLLGAAGASLLVWLSSVGAGPAQSWPEPLTSVLTVMAFTLPAVLVVVPLMLRASRGQGAGVAGWPPMAGLILAPVSAAAMSAGNQLRLVLFDQTTPGLPIITWSEMG